MDDALTTAADPKPGSYASLVRQVRQCFELASKIAIRTSVLADRSPAAEIAAEREVLRVEVEALLRESSFAALAMKDLLTKLAAKLVEHEQVEGGKRTAGDC
jgi:hypothetical protein